MNTFNKKLPILTIILFLATAGQFATDIYLPSLPALTHYFQTNEAVTQLTIAIFLVGLGISNLIYGPLSDCIGRRKTLFLGLSLATAGSFFCMLAPSIETLIFARFLQGLGLGACMAIARAIMRDVFSGTELVKAGSYLGSLVSVTLAGAPIIGGVLETYFNWRVSFLFLFIYQLAILLIVWRFLPETHHARENAPRTVAAIAKNYGILLISPVFFCYALISSLTYAGITAYISASPFLFQNVLKLTPAQNGLLALSYTIAFAVNGFVNAHLINRFSINQLIKVGIFFKFFAGIFLFVVPLFMGLNTFTLVLSSVFFSIGSSFLFANSSVAAMQSFAKTAGSAGALFNCFQLVTAALCISITAMLQTDSAMPLSFVFMILAAISFTALKYVARRDAAYDTVSSLSPH